MVLQLLTLHNKSYVLLPVLVRGTRSVKARPHQREGQVEVLQVKGKGLPGSPICLCATPPLALDLHGDWTLIGCQDSQSIPLAQVC